MDCKSVGERVKARKQALGLTVNDLSVKSGVPEDTINNIIYGRTTDPRTESLIRITRALDTSLDYIVLGTTSTPSAEDAPRADQTRRFDIDSYVHSLKENHAREIASLIESHDRHIKDVKEAHEREIRAVKEHCTEIKRSRYFWRALSCGLIAISMGILTWFILKP